MKRFVIWLIVAILVLAAGVTAWYKFNLTELTDDVGSGQVIIETETRKEEAPASDSAPGFIVAAEYPKISGLSDLAVQARLNAEIKSEVDGIVNANRGEGEIIDANSIAQSSSVNVDYKIESSHGSILPIVFTVSAYTAGAAHPNNFYQTLNLDLAIGEEVTLAEFFKPGTKYLEIFAPLAAQAVAKEQNIRLEPDTPITAQDEWIKGGTKAEATNYQNYLFTAEGIKLFFDPYQVASYAAGGFEVLLPYAAFGQQIIYSSAEGEFNIKIK